MGDYIEAEYAKTVYTCPHCGIVSQMHWSHMYAIIKEDGDFLLSYDDNLDYIDYEDEIDVVACSACNNIQIWINRNMIFPLSTNLPLANTNMPESVRQVYDEAKEIYSKSPRASAALLRLGLQNLCKDLGEKGDNINDDIKSLVKKGLPSSVQKALDSIRVIGNNAVHPGTIDLNDESNVARTLFEILNFIIEKMITEPKKIDEIYDLLPEGAKQQIKKRDGILDVTT